MITNSNYGKHTPNNCYREHISVLGKVIREEKKNRKKEIASSSTESENESLISKTAGPIDARKKGLVPALQVCHLLLQSLNPCINSINSWLNSPYKKGSSNLMKMIQNKLHSKTHIDKLLNRSPPLQDPLGGDSVDKVMLNVVHHAP